MGDSYAKVSVTVANCRNLFPLGLGKTSNPYVKVFGSDEKLLCKTQVIEKNVNPDFNSGPHTFIIPMYSILEFKVYHHLPHEDQFLGRANLTIYSVEKEKTKELVLSYGGDATLEAKTKSAGGCGKLCIVYSVENATADEAAKANKKPEENFDDLDFLNDGPPKPKKGEGLDFLSSASDTKPVVPVTIPPPVSQPPPSQPQNLAMSSAGSSLVSASNPYASPNSALNIGNQPQFASVIPTAATNPTTSGLTPTGLQQFSPPEPQTSLPTPTPVLAPQTFTPSAHPYMSANTSTPQIAMPVETSNLFSMAPPPLPPAPTVATTQEPITITTTTLPPVSTITNGNPVTATFTSTSHSQPLSAASPLDALGSAIHASQSLGPTASALVPPLHPNTSSPLTTAPEKISAQPSTNLHSSSATSVNSSISRVPSIVPAAADQSAANMTSASDLSAPAAVAVTTHNTSVLSPPPPAPAAATPSAPTADSSGLATKQVRFDATTTKPLRHSQSPANRSTSATRKKTPSVSATSAGARGRSTSPSTRKVQTTNTSSQPTNTLPATTNSIVSVAPVPTAPSLHGATASNKALYGGSKSQELLRAAVDGDIMPFRAVKELDPLLAHGFMQVTDYAGRNALHLAAWYGHVDLLDCLLGSGAASMLNISSMLTKNAKNTLLHTAALGGSPAAVEWLLFQPACQSLPLARNTRGLTPYQCALEAGHIECAKALAIASGMRENS